MKTRRHFLMSMAGAAAGLFVPAPPVIFDMKPKRIVTPQEIADRILKNARFIVETDCPPRRVVGSRGNSPFPFSPTLYRREECIGAVQAVCTAASLANITGGVARITSPDLPDLNEAVTSEPPPLYLGGNQLSKSLGLADLQEAYELERSKCHGKQ